MTVNRWISLFVILCVLAGGVVIVTRLLPANFGRPSVIENELVGQSEETILRKYGAAERDQTGYRSLGPQGPPRLPAGAVRTLHFRLRGATLVVWLVQRSDGWICFESCQFADDVAF